MEEREVVERLRAERLLPVATLAGAAEGEAVARALLAAGRGCVEVTFRTEGSLEALRAARAVEGLLVGAGTVLRPEQARLAAEAGADFAVAPCLAEDVVETCRGLGLPFFPGVATPSEIDRARRLGLTTLKVFPAEQLGGPAFLHSVSAVFPDVGFVPTGGIRPQTVDDYLAVPSVVACGGSWLVPRGRQP